MFLFLCLHSFTLTPLLFFDSLKLSFNPEFVCSRLRSFLFVCPALLLSNNEFDVFVLLIANFCILLELLFCNVIFIEHVLRARALLIFLYARLPRETVWLICYSAGLVNH
jgi:hypothetical protein